MLSQNNPYTFQSQIAKLQNSTSMSQLQDLMQDTYKKFTKKSGVQMTLTNHNTTECDCQSVHYDRSNAKYCQKCGLVSDVQQAIEDSQEMRGAPNNYIKYLNKDIREMMKYSTFERQCADKISNKSKHNIPESILKQALADVQEIWNVLNIKGNNPTKLFIFRVAYYCQLSGIQCNIKSLSCDFGNTTSKKQSWIQQGQRIYQDYLFMQGNHHESIPNQQTILKSQDDDIVIAIFKELEQTHHILFQITNVVKSTIFQSIVLYLQLLDQQHPDNNEHLKKYGICWSCFLERNLQTKRFIPAVRKFNQFSEFIINHPTITPKLQSNLILMFQHTQK